MAERSLSSEQLVRIIDTIWRLLRASAATAGGTWSQNLLPVIEPVVLRIVSASSIRALSGAIVVREMEGAAFSQSRDAHLTDVQAYVNAAPESVAAAARKALLSGADLLDRLTKTPAPRAVLADILTLRDVVRAVAHRTAVTPAEQLAILHLRSVVAEDPANVLARDALFDLESR